MPSTFSCHITSNDRTKLVEQGHPMHEWWRYDINGTHVKVRVEDALPLRSCKGKLKFYIRDGYPEIKPNTIVKLIDPTGFAVRTWSLENCSLISDQEIAFESFSGDWWFFDSSASTSND